MIAKLLIKILHFYFLNLISTLKTVIQNEPSFINIRELQILLISSWHFQILAIFLDNFIIGS